MAKKKSNVNLIGSWAFIIGVILALIVGLFDAAPILTWLLIVLGLVVGVLNVSGKEATTFLFVSLVLVVISAFTGGMVANDNPYILGMLRAIVIFIAPAALLVALKAIYGLARD